MINRTMKPFLWAAIFILVIGMACTAVTGDTGPDPVDTPVEVVQDPTAEPTEPPAPTAEPTIPDPTEPDPDIQPDDPTAFTGLSTELYRHSGGLFEFYPPEGWTPEEDDGSVAFESPDGSGFIYVQVTNTGYELDGAGFESFIDARELNFFGGFEGYSELERDIDS